MCIMAHSCLCRWASSHHREVALSHSTLSAVEKGEAAMNAMHFISVILRGMGHHFRASTQGEEDLHSLQTQRFLPGGAEQVVPAEQMVSTLPAAEDSEIPLFTEPLQQEE